ncbi:CHAP domain-containing protein [Candidatus Saccharibacteria bacterium]|nr:CHAP domain-containing protein [Candidatus Saccharibacteria bacterium]
MMLMLHAHIKTMKQKHNKARQLARTSAKTMVLVMLVGVMAAGIVVQPMALADQYDEQIRQIEAQNSQKQSKVDQLQEKADSYQDAVDKLQAQINTMQAQIRKNQQKRDELQKQIDIAQKELDKQRHVLGENIKAMYVEGDITTLEMLASSKDLSEFFNKQQYRDSVQQKVKATLDKVNALKDQLRHQKNLVEELIADQKEIESQLNDDKSTQQKLLAYTDSQKAEFNSQINKNNSKIAELRAQQAAANQSLGGTATAGDPGHGGYPAYLDNAPQDSLIDPWGMYNRECVSYTAWKVYQTYGHMPYWGGVGNANQWPGNAARYNIPTGSTPRAKSVAVSMAGYYGHVMWVEEVYGNGYIRVSQYNYDLAGHYSEMVINGSGLVYIYFN